MYRKSLLNPTFRAKPETTTEVMELGEAVDSFIACLKDPARADPDPRLEAVIEKKALSKGTLVSVKQTPEQNGLIVDIAEIESGKLFFPVQFIAQDTQINDEAVKIISQPPLKVLFNPTHYLGYPKWICVSSDEDRFSLTAYPMPLMSGHIHKLASKLSLL